MSSVIRGSDNFDSGLGLGVGQTWQNVKTTPGRVLGTTYTNTTGKPIMVSVSASATIGNNLALAAIVGGVQFGSSFTPPVGGSSNQVVVTTIVPNGSSYSVNVVGGVLGTLDTWVELR